MSRTSSDGGATWGKPGRIARETNSWLFDPWTGEFMRTGSDTPSLLEQAVDPSSGRVYVTWQDGAPDVYNVGHILLSSSSNGGRTWTTPIRIDASGSRPAFTPMIAVDPENGTVGVSYASFRHASDEVSQFLATCSSSCATDPGSWAETQIGGAVADDTFLLRTAPYALGLFLGDYTALASNGDGFLAFYALPLATGDTPYSGTNIWSTFVPN